MVVMTDGIYRVNAEHVSLDLVELESGTQQVQICNEADTNSSAVIIFPNVVLAQMSNYMLEEKRGSEEKPPTPLVFRISRHFRNCFLDEIQPSEPDLGFVRLPDEVQDGDSFWFSGRARHALPFTVADSDGRIERLDDIRTFMAEAQSSFLVDVGIKVGLPPPGKRRIGPEWTEFDVDVVDVHVRRFTSVALPRFFWGRDNVAADLRPSAKLLEELQEQGYLRTEDA